MEGEIEKDSEVQATYKDLHAKRPIIHKVIFLHSWLIFQVTYRLKRTVRFIRVMPDLQRYHS